MKLAGNSVSHFRVLRFAAEPLESRIAPAVIVALGLGSLDGRKGFQISGEAGGDSSGRSVSAAGDVNGDGFGDLVIGAPGADVNGSYSGASYVVFGKQGGSATNLNLSALDGTNGFQINGEAPGDGFGRSVSQAGDVNGDGFGDLIIGAPNSKYSLGNSEFSGSYVVFGKASGFSANLEVSALDGSNGFKISGEAAGDDSGLSVSAAGDINGDGFGDLIVGAPSKFLNFAFSASYVVFGKAGPFAANLDLSALAGANGFQINAAKLEDEAGISVSGAGDVNGDGLDDLIIGAPGYGLGASYVVFGKMSAFAAELNLSALDGNNGFKIINAGSSVSAAGDLNGDGLDDLIVGSPDLYSGASYVVFGKTGGFSANLDVTALAGTNGFKITGEAAGDGFGVSVSAAGDVNGDGFGDLLVGAPGAGSFGVTYVVFGKAGGFAANLNVSALDGANGFQITGETENDRSGYSVSGGGDFNGDGFADLLIGAPGAGPAGASYLVFGKPSPAKGSLMQDLKSVTYLEPDGDHVVISISEGNLAAEQITLEPVIGGYLLRTLEIAKAAGNKVAQITVGVPAGGVGTGVGAGQADIGLVNVLAGARLSELRLNGDLTALFIEAGGRVDLVHASSVGVHQTLFFGIEPGLVFASRAADIEVGGNVVDSAVLLTHGGERVQVEGDWLRSTLHSQGRLDELQIDGALRDSRLSGEAPAHSGSAGATTVFGSIFIQGNVERSKVLAGFDDLGTPVGGASIGTITIGGDLSASDIAAGAIGGLDGLFGTRDDLAIKDDDRFPAQIGKIVIESISAASAGRFGIVAEKIGSLIVGGQRVSLQPGARNDLIPIPVGSSGKVAVREVAASIDAKVSLLRLDGTDGFQLRGAADYDHSGLSVSGAGDVNGDGFGDLIIGARDADKFSGASYVVFGKAGGFRGTLDLSTLDGSNGFRIGAEAPADGVGRSVSGAGDVNGDGFSDLIIGAAEADPNGASYVIFGKTGGFAANLNLAALDGSNGFKISGETAGLFDFSVSGAGDVNGDGFGDLLIGAPPTFLNAISTSYVIYGRTAGFPANLNLSALDGVNGFRISGEAPADGFGRSVSGAGDVNGDGFADLLIGAPLADPNGFRSGASYVVFGKAGGFAANLNVAGLDGSEGFQVNGEAAGDYAGSSVRGAGDVNGDGFDDLLIGAPHFSLSTSEPGSSYVVFGKAGGFSANLEMSALDGSNGFKIGGQAGALSGFSVSGAGDFNGDGFADLLIGAPGRGNSIFGLAPIDGASYVVFGKAGGFAANLNLGTLNAINGFSIPGGPALGRLGDSVSGAGDVNGDGFADLLVGAPHAGKKEPGSSFVVFGSPASQIDDSTVAFTEADGDRVIVSVKGGTITTGALVFEEVGGQKIYNLKTLDLSHDPNLDGAEVTVTAVPADQASFHGALAASAGSVGIPNIGTVMLPQTGGPKTVTVQGNVQQVNVPAAAALKVFSVNSLGIDSDIFPDIAPRFFGAGTIVKVAVAEDVTNFTFDVPGAVDLLTVGGDITGSTLTFANKLTSLTVGDSLPIAHGNIANSFLSFAKGVGTVKVGGDIKDTQITAEGKLQPASAGLAVVLGKLTVGNNVERSQMLAGYTANGQSVNPDAGIGAVKIGGVLLQSSIVAGASKGQDGLFGTGDDALLAGNGLVVAKIASIIITGGVSGTVASGDGFGIVAGQIGKLTIGTTPSVLKKGPGNDLIDLGATHDAFLREVLAAG
ncbi:MAG: hypothetical protein QOE70_6536 [Chthoniobacter sp.]|jgi:hypothetical protein|nr:hypothetical protein [Chthoniobacter sp.]